MLYKIRQLGQTREEIDSKAQVLWNSANTIIFNSPPVVHPDNPYPLNAVEGGEARQEGLGLFAQVYANPALDGDFYALTRMAKFTKNANNWSFAFKARTGVFDRVYRTLLPNVSFSGFTMDMTRTEIAEQIASNMNQAAEDDHLTSFEPISLLVGVENELREAGGLGNVSVAATVLSIPEFKLYITNCHNLNRAYYGKKASLSENAKKRMKRYLAKDSRELNKIRQFVGTNL